MMKLVSENQVRYIVAVTFFLNMKIFISCGHNNAFIHWYSKYRDQGATNTSFGNTMTEFQFSKKLSGEIQKKFPAEN